MPASSNGKITGASTNGVWYEFSLDNWSQTGLTFGWSGCIGCTSITATAADTFHNTDFEKALALLMGPTAYAACGFDSSAATFYLAPHTIGYPNGYFGWGWADSVSGGCSDLVHFRENHGSGSSS